jgi:hypothetical protein
MVAIFSPNSFPPNFIFVTFFFFFLLLSMFRSLYSVYCWYVNVYCTAATGCQLKLQLKINKNNITLQIQI